jgi:signal transduction histidine kinase
VAEEVARRAATALEHARLYELAQAERRRAEEANRAKDEFLATLSHELRTPLTAILGWTQMLRSGVLSPAKQARALETVERNARAQTQLIEDLLDVSRIITGKMRLVMQPVQLARVVEAALESVRPAADARDIALEAAFGAQAEAAVSGDPDRLQQVAWNLLSNAIKFTPAGGRVHVRVEREDASLLLEVQDSGQGIRADFLPYVFDRFRQQDGAATRAHGGLGLGLAIVRHLVELHGGSVGVHSAGEGQGATFTVRLPLAPGA